MLIFISGGVRSGKSQLGENMAEKLASMCGGRKIYLATALVYDDEMRKRVERHQKNRRAKGYITIEKGSRIGEIKDRLTSGDIVLLDCLGSLVANEMFDGNRSDSDTELIDRIFADIQKVDHAVNSLVIVSNDVFFDGISYQDTVRSYVSVLGKLHVKIAGMADTAVECACGIHLYHRGKAP